MIADGHDKASGAEKPDPGDLYHDADLAGHGKFCAGVQQNAPCVVCGADHRLAACPGDERQSGCDLTDNDPGGYAGKGIFL